jgi:hypothetical protein
MFAAAGQWIVCSEEREAARQAGSALTTAGEPSKLNGVLGMEQSPTKRRFAVASVPVGQTAAQTPGETLEERFHRLAAGWRAATSHLSSSTQMAAHPAYREIIGLGMEAVPLLLADLARQPDHWFTALKAITGANPVDSADRGRIDRMAAAWLKWGRENGYSW